MPITIRFVDFWDGFKPQHLFLTKVLQGITPISIIDEGEPDILIYTCFGEAHYNFTNCIKIYISGENDVPDFNFCDYAISYRYLQLENRHLRFPICIADKIERILCNQTLTLSPKQAFDRDFCSIVVSNSHHANPIRDTLWQQLNEYKTISSGGLYNNNVGEPVPDKLAFIKNFKFNIAFENSMADGYTTEKILEACIAGTVPIYWGNKLIHKDFNPEAFINISDFDSINNAVDYIIKVDNDPCLYAQYLNSDLLKNYPYEQHYEELKSFLSIILTQRRKRTTMYGRTMIMLEQQQTKLQQISAYQQLSQATIPQREDLSSPSYVEILRYKVAQRIKRFLS